MKIAPSSIPGCARLELLLFRDARGALTKTYHEALFRQAGLPFVIAEQYFSVSTRGVLRGLHFQLPPADHAKIVVCVEGEILDAVVDLRAGSPTYGRHELFALAGGAGDVLHVPRGCAHGFWVKSDRAVVLNNATSVHSPAHDTGIRWDSAGIPWPDAGPVLSRKDAELPALADFRSPFVFADASDAGPA